MRQLTLQETSFILDFSIEYTQYCLHEGLLKSLWMEDIIEFKNELHAQKQKAYRDNALQQQQYEDEDGF